MLKRLAVIPFIIGFAVLAASCLVTKARVFTVGADYVYVGEAVNLTQADVEQSYVKLEYLDGASNVIATQFVSPCTRTLQAGASSPVEGSLPNGGISVVSVRATVQWVTVAHRDPASMTFSNLDVSQSADGTKFFVAGTVGNNSAATTYAGVHVCAAAYGGDGNVVAVGDGYLDTATLSAGNASDFSFSANMSGAAAQYRLWVDGWDVGNARVTAPVTSALAAVPTATPTSTNTPVPPTNTPLPTSTPTP